MWKKKPKKESQVLKDLRELREGKHDMIKSKQKRFKELQKKYGNKSKKDS